MSLVAKLFNPKKNLFYDLFNDVGEKLLKTGACFSEMTKINNLGEAEKLRDQIEDLEHKTDELTHLILTELSLNFITPFDREDVHDLANTLDDVADHIYTSSKRIVLYKLYPLDDYCIKFIHLINQGIIELNKAIKELKNLKSKRVLTDAIMAINSLEKQADELYDSAISNLFDNENDTKEFIKKRDIYQKLELVTDVIEDASNVIESILIKYS